MAGHLDGADVGGVPLRTDVVVLYYPRGVKVMNEGLCLPAPFGQLLSDAVVDGGVGEVGVRVEPVAL